LAGPTEPEAVDEAVRVARATARPLAAALLALEASGGVLGLALAGLPEPARENMEQVLNAEEQVPNAEEQAILASNVADVRAKWAVVLRKAAGACRIPGEAGELCVQFPVGISGKHATMKITVNARCMAHALLSQEDENYDKPVAFEQVLIDKEKMCKYRE
jgi:hypothetical protein